MSTITIILIEGIIAGLLIIYFMHVEFSHRNKLAEKREKEFIEWKKLKKVR